MSGCTREIITLQVGHYANFVGTHWWNLQEASFIFDESAVQTDINHDYMFQEGLTPNRLQTYTPRLLAIDAKGSLNNLACLGTLYEPPRTPSPLEASWNGSVTLVHQLHSEKNDFLKDLEKDDARFLKSIDEDKDICIDDYGEQSSSKSDRSESPQKLYNLKKGVKVWSDFLHTHLHPKSIYMLNDVWHQQPGSCREEVYWGFLPGTAIMKKESCQDEIFDRIRLLAESCGSFQGFQLLTDGHNGMGGVSCGISQYLADEFSSKDIISFPITPPHFSAENVDISSHCLASLIQCYTELSSLTSLVVPLNLKQHGWSSWSQGVQFPHLKFDESCAYESSCINAAFLETATLAYRSRNSPMPMNYLVDLLTLGGCKIAAGSFAFPVGLPSDTDLLGWLKGEGRIELVPMTSGCDIHLNPISECQIVRGLNDKITRNNPYAPPSSQFSSVARLYEQYLQEKRFLSRTRYIASVRDPIKTGKTFPHIFSSDVDSKGFINSSNNSIVTSSPSIAGLHQGQGVGNILSKLLTSGTELNISRLPNLIEDGIDCESWSDQIEDLRTLVGCYGLSPNVETDSDDD